MAGLDLDAVYFEIDEAGARVIVLAILGAPRRHGPRL
jgi:hypothetical protein